MIYLNELSVNEFRGIRGLKVKDIGNINLIVGDNNSGKTSVLEAIMLLRNVNDISNVLNVARLRTYSSLSPFRQNLFDDFLCLFNRTHEDKGISVDGKLGDKDLGISIYGNLEKVMVDYRELMEISRRELVPDSSESIYGENEIEEFRGILKNYYGKNQYDSKRVQINQFTRLTGTRVKGPSLVEMVYISPTEHAFRNIFYQTIKNDSYKEIVLKVIQIFDVDIEDMLYLKNEQSSHPIECLRHKKLGVMPITTYGDGIKKVLLLANSIARAANGILLVDEIETAIHAKYYDDIFKFVIKACIKFNIQLFATTHSIEAVDGFLATQYDDKEEVYDQEDRDLIRVITFRKNDEKDKTDARVLSGKEVFKKRDRFEFEVRV